MPDYKTYFKKVLKVTEGMSTCVMVSVAALIVKDGRIVSTGWNGTPKGADHCGDVFVFGRIPDISHHEWSAMNEIHAEQNAIGFAARSGVSTCGAEMYISISPCVSCAKQIIASGITCVYYDEVYARGEKRGDSGIELLKKHNIKRIEI